MRSHLSRVRRWALVVALGMVFALLPGIGGSPPAEAAFPGQNGQVAFEVGGLGLVVMDADATFTVTGYWPHEYTITGGDGFVPFWRKGVDDPVWSADGELLAFTWGDSGPLSEFGADEACNAGGGGIGVMNADGTVVECLIDTNGFDEEPAWSPDGTKLAFQSNETGSTRLHVLDVVTKSWDLLTGLNSYDPAWSPDGTKIVFVGDSSGYGHQGAQDIYVVNPDGTGLAQLTANGAEDGSPAWSPDGSQIAYSGRTGPWWAQSEIYVMNADGSGTEALTDTAADEYNPQWSPDGSEIIFGSVHSRGHSLYRMQATGGTWSQVTFHNPGGGQLYTEDADWKCDPCGAAGNFFVDPENDWIAGWAWYPNQPVSVTVNGTDYSEVATTGANGSFGIWTPLTDIEVDDTVTVTVGFASVSHNVLELDVTEVNWIDDTVSGTAPPDSWIRVVIHPGNPYVNVLTGGDGTWTADFASLFDIEPGQAGVAVRHDVNLTQTKLQWTANTTVPDVQSVTAPVVPTQLGTEIFVSGEFTDEAAFEIHTAEWDWGDETTSAGIVVEEDGTVTGSRTYQEPGVYEVALTVTNVAGNSDTQVFQYVVIYDPAGGFVTGGGWIDSPAGAYVADPDLTGRANFGFVSKYKKGATVPTGQTEFQFHAGDLEFHSDSYDWLVITGGDTAKFKGVGTLNGEAGFRFQVWADDGDTDTFRIRIWTEDGGIETDVYDNGFGSELGGGNIVVHKK